MYLQDTFTYLSKGYFSYTQREVNKVKLLLKFTVLRNIVFQSKICVALVHTFYAQNSRKS